MAPERVIYSLASSSLIRSLPWGSSFGHEDEPPKLSLRRPYTLWQNKMAEMLVRPMKNAVLFVSGGWLVDNFEPAKVPALYPKKSHLSTVISLAFHDRRWDFDCSSYQRPLPMPRHGTHGIPPQIDSMGPYQFLTDHFSHRKGCICLISMPALSP